MVALSLVALAVFIFGAYVYGATVVYALRQPATVPADTGHAMRPAARINAVVFTLCVVCTVWFILQALVEVHLLMGGLRFSTVLGIAATIMTFAFPPLIMHTVLVEAKDHGNEQLRARRWRVPVYVMYVVSNGVGVVMLLAGLGVIEGPRPYGAWTGFSVGFLFMLCSVYCIVLMSRRRRSTATSDQRRLRSTMTVLFFAMIAVFFLLTFFRQERVLLEVLDRFSRGMPLYFLLASIYFENRFEFYDLVVKRGTLLLVSVALIGGYLSLLIGWLDVMAQGAARPWLIAAALVPIAMAIPWMHARLGRRLDILWFGRQFTPVEAVKQVLSAMQPATDERALVAATEAELTRMFGNRAVILLDDQPPPEGAAVEAIVANPAGDKGPSIRVAIVSERAARPLLSEDLMLLRSLTGVFGYMLENVRLHRKRLEQEQVAQELRLQSSRSELKALRAQINPHFLFNALNAIASLIHTDPARADAAVEQLAEVFRYTLRRSEQEWTPLDQELAFAQAYLEVEQARFGKRLSFTIDADPVTARLPVPSMLLQTLVENAVKHGIAQTRQPGRIEIHATQDGAALTLEVRDSGPGPGAPSRHLPGEGFGLRSVRDRLAGHFGDRAALTLTRDPDGMTVARIRMPLPASEAAAVAR